MAFGFDDAALLLPSVFGIIGSLFGGKGKKSQYSAMQTPQQAQYYNKMLSQIGGRMGQPSPGQQTGQDVMNMLYSTYFGRPFQSQQQPSVGVPYAPRPTRMPGMM